MQELLDIEDVEELEHLFHEKSMHLLMADFISQEAESNPTYEFWWLYMRMVGVLLMFTRSMRIGDWQLYKHSLALMLPLMARYDHLKYLKSLSVFIAEMHQLPIELEAAFLNGDFCIQASNEKFAQVDADHAQEWLVGVCKDSGGLIGITQRDAALQRWALSYHWRSEITLKTFNLFGLSSDMDTTFQYPGAKKRDNEDENKIFDLLIASKVFSRETDSRPLLNIVNKDVTTDKIEKSLLNVFELGQTQVTNFVNDRLIFSDEQPQTLSYHAPIKKCCSSRFSDLYKVTHTTTSKRVSCKAGYNILRRLLACYQAGRKINLSLILKHELYPVPTAVADSNGDLKIGTDKSQLFNTLKALAVCPSAVAVQKNNSHLIIDGQAMVNALGKPGECRTFGNYAEIFFTNLTSVASPYCQVDIVFDRYRMLSIKHSTRQHRASRCNPVRRVIEHEGVPLPVSWKNFMALPDNKMDLQKFLSYQLLTRSFGSLVVVAAGGLDDEREAVCSSSSVNLEQIEGSHEEADTRMILHAVNSSYRTVVVSARDTDVLVLLIHHFSRMKCKILWMRAGTASKRIHVPVHDIVKKLTPTEIKNLPAMHAITGSDCTSHLHSVSKPAAFAIFRKHAELLSGLGNTILSAHDLKLAERFMALLYKVRSPKSLTVSMHYYLLSDITSTALTFYRPLLR